MSKGANEPKPHSFAQAGQDNDGRLFAPAAARNAEPILQALLPHLPQKGTILEIASGTGEHVVRFAEAAAHLTWQPTDIATERLESITAWTRHTGLTNILPPVAFDAVAGPWPGDPVEGVFLSNLVHLISEQDAKALLRHMSQALSANGRLALYGPFKRGDAFVSAGDQRFNAAIRAERPDAGYKSIDWVTDALTACELYPIETIAMPANNLLTLWKAPS